MAFLCWYFAFVFQWVLLTPAGDGDVMRGRGFSNRDPSAIFGKDGNGRVVSIVVFRACVS